MLEILEEILRKGSSATKMAVERVKTVRKSFSERKTPFLRGFLIHRKDINAEATSENLKRIVINEIKNYSQFSDEQRNALITWEEFQAKQKGRTGPIKSGAYDEMILDGLQVKDYDINASDRHVLDQASNSLFQYLSSFFSIEIDKIDFEAAWKTLPSSTVRGYPYNARGESCDDKIIAQGGNSFDTAYAYSFFSDKFICFSGYRIQGKPYPKDVKIRNVFIVPVYTQYLDVGIVKTMMNKMKIIPCFSGWMNPADRLRTISNMMQISSRDGYKIIQLDYSAYDKHIHPYFIQLVNNFYELVTVDRKDKMAKRNARVLKWLENQYVLLPDKRNNPTLYKIPYQLPSGKINTQLDGTLIGLIIMGFIYILLFHYKPEDIPWSLMLQLGDDAGLPVPKTILQEKGYINLLKEISALVSNLHFDINHDKAYPTPDLSFLQKLYIPELDIMYQGAWTRSIASFFFKEKQKLKIKGITNMWAMDIISQITIFSDPYSSSKCNTNFIGSLLAQWWIDQDDRFRAILVKLKSENDLTPNSIFRTLIKLTNLNVDQVYEYIIGSYDHKGYQESFKASDYGLVFPILKDLCEAKLKPVSEKHLRFIISQNNEQNQDPISDVLEDDVV